MLGEKGSLHVSLPLSSEWLSSPHPNTQIIPERNWWSRVTFTTNAAFRDYRSFCPWPTPGLLEPKKKKSNLNFNLDYGRAKSNKIRSCRFSSQSHGPCDMEHSLAFDRWSNSNIWFRLLAQNYILEESIIFSRFLRLFSFLNNRNLLTKIFETTHHWIELDKHSYIYPYFGSM